MFRIVFNIIKFKVKGKQIEKLLLSSIMINIMIEFVFRILNNFFNSTTLQFILIGDKER